MSATFGRRDDLGLALTLLRRFKGWTQARLAAESGISLSGLRVVEQGKSRPTQKTLGAIAEALGVDLASMAETVTLSRGLRGAGGGPLAVGTGSSDAADATGETLPTFRPSVNAAMFSAAGIEPSKAALHGHGAARRPTQTIGNAKDLGLALMLLRWHAGWKREELAAAAGLSRAALEGIEQGTRRRISAEMQLVLETLGVDSANLTQAIALIHTLRRLVDAPPPAEPPKRALPLRERLVGLMLAAAGVEGRADIPREASRE